MADDKDVALSVKLAADDTEIAKALDNLKARGEASARALSESFSKPAAAFGQLAQAIQREQQMLERIHGPARRYAEDLQTLDSLLERGIISTGDYAAQLTKLNRAIDGMPKELPAPKAAAQTGEVSKIDAFAKQAAESTKILSERVREIGKGVAFGLVAQQFQNLKGVIDETTASTISAGASGAAMGATFAGPWGAAIGGAIGLAKGFVTGLLDSEKASEALRKKIEEEGAAYWAQVDAAKRAHLVAESLAVAQSALAEAERHATEAAEEHKRVLNEAPEAFRHAADKARAYQDQLTEVDYLLREQLKLQGLLADRPEYDANSGQAADQAKAISASRGLRDAELERYAATKSYGDLYKELTGAENARADRMRDLEGILGDVNASEKVKNRALKEYNELATEAAKKTAELAKAAKDLAAANLKAWKPVLDSANEQKDAWASVRIEEARALGLAQHDVDVEEKYDALEKQKNEPDLEADLRAYDAMQKAAKDKRTRDSSDGKADSFLKRMGLADPDGLDVAATALQGFADTYANAMEQMALASGSAGEMVQQGFGMMVAGVGKKLLAYGAAELVEAGAHAILGDFAGAARHAGAGALYTAGGFAAFRAAKALGYTGSAGAAGGSASAGGGGGASSGDGRDHRTGGDGPLSETKVIRETIVAYESPFAQATERMKKRQAELVVGRVLGGEAWSND